VPRFDHLIRRLATNYDGEGLATVAALQPTLATAKASFHDLADVVVLGAKPRVERDPPPRRRSQRTPDGATMLDDLLDHPQLTDWEYSFVESVYGQFRRRWRLSEKQLDVLFRIWRKIKARAA
jgi:hypothetical protein